MSTKQELWDAYTHADARWSHELIARYGILAGDARYGPAGRGEPGSRLKALHDLRESARVAYETHTGGVL